MIPIGEMSDSMKERWSGWEGNSGLLEPAGTGLTEPIMHIPFPVSMENGRCFHPELLLTTYCPLWSLFTSNALKLKFSCSTSYQNIIQSSVFKKSIFNFI